MIDPQSNSSRRSFLKATSLVGFGTVVESGIVGRVFAEDQATQNSKGPSGAGLIRPFQVNVPDSELADLRRRILTTRWPEREVVDDASQGVQLDTMQ